MTYKPKIPAVRSGECTQTIRPKSKRNIDTGDIILFHGWAGRPYRSKWSWRLTVKISELIDIWVSSGGISLDEKGEFFVPWNRRYCDKLAERDYIVPPTGKALGELLASMYRLGENNNPEPFQIIRWSRKK